MSIPLDSIVGPYQTSTTFIGSDLSPLIINDDGSIDIAGTLVTGATYNPASGVLQIPTCTIGQRTISGTITFATNGTLSGQMQIAGFPQTATISGSSEFLFQTPTLQNAFNTDGAFDVGDSFWWQTPVGTYVGIGEGGYLEVFGRGEPGFYFGITPSNGGVMFDWEDNPFVVQPDGRIRMEPGGTGTVFSVMATLDGAALLTTPDGRYVTLNNNGVLICTGQSALSIAMEWQLRIKHVEPAELLKRWQIEEFAEIDQCTTDIASLVWQVTGGFFLALGLGPYMATGQVRVGVVGILRSNANVWAKVTAAVATLRANPEISSAGMGALVTGILGAAWGAGLLWKVVKFILIQAGWWILFKVVAKILEVVFLAAVEIAELIASFAVWIGGLIKIAVNIHHDCASNTLPSLAAANKAT